MDLMEHQLEVIPLLSSGKILFGGVGTGKSATVLAYYLEKEFPRKLVILTTAKKRDELDWKTEAAEFGLVVDDIAVDSWNNIHKYTDIKDAFFVLDEQRVVGTGAWVKAFLKIAKNNRWILLSATPGDQWLDYAPVFVANGFYKSIREFKERHVIYVPFIKYPKVKAYWNEKYLEKLRDHVLVEMPYLRNTTRIVNWLDVGYDEALYKRVWKDRWHVYEDRPIVDAAEMFRVARKVVNSDPSRLEMVRKLMKCHPRLIVFYTFNYELSILRELYGEIEVGEWNGHKKDPLPESDRWVYLVQYVSGAESWNCTSTNAMIFYSLTYSYKNFMQAQGRIDRLNTKYQSLYFYVFVAFVEIDQGIKKALKLKKNFNERAFLTSYNAEMS